MKLRAIAIALVAVLTSGCATIPQSGAVNVGQDVSSSLTSDEVYYSQTGPYQDASPEAILYGFLSAGNGPQNDYSVAREYLTPDLASSWKPSEEVLIQDGVPEIQKLGAEEYAVTISVSARVDADGHYSEEPAGTNRYLKYQLIKNNGEWRIDQAPNLTSINRSNFGVLFHQYSLYFYEPSLRYLVPDVRWFPSRASTGTRLINALLKGPSDWLRPAVVNVIPSGTKLNINSVTVTDGVAAVDLSSSALKISAAQKPLVKAQILATLEQLSDVSNVAISIQRTPQSIALQGDNRLSVLSISPVVATPKGIFRLIGDSMQNIPGTSSKIANSGATDFAYSEKLRKLALVNSTGVQLFTLDTFDEDTTLVDSRPNQLAPQFDVWGGLWTIPKARGAAFVVTSDSRRVLTNPWIDGIPVDFSISPEGSRLVVSYLIGSTHRTYLFPIERDKSGNAVAIGSPISIPGFASSATWSSDVELVLVEGSTISRLVVGGRILMSKALANTKSAVASGGGAIYALQNGGSVSQSRSTSWFQVADDVIALHLSNQ